MGALVGTMKKKDLKIYLFFRLSLGVRSSVSLAIGEYYHLSGGGGEEEEEGNRRILIVS